MKKAIALTLTLAMAVTMAGCGNNQKGTVTSASGKKISTDLIKGSIKLADYKGLEVYEDEIKVETFLKTLPQLSCIKMKAWNFLS